MPLKNMAYTGYGLPSQIVGRTKSAEYSLWEKIKLFDTYSKEKQFFISNAFKHLGIDLKNPDKQKIKEVARSFLEDAVFKHEQGHHQTHVKGIFPYPDLGRALNLVIKKGNHNLESFLVCIHECLANTIPEHGMYSRILKQDKDFIKGILFLEINRFIEPEHKISEVLSRVSPEIVIGLCEYYKTGNIQNLKEAVNTIFERNKQVAWSVRGYAEDYNLLKRVQERIYRETEKAFEEAHKMVKEIVK